MHLHIIEDRQLTPAVCSKRATLVSNVIAPNRKPQCGRNFTEHWMLSGHVRAWGDTTPEYWIDGRRLRAAMKAPQRKMPCCSRALSVDPSLSSFDCDQSILGGGSTTHRVGRSIACSAQRVATIIAKMKSRNEVGCLKLPSLVAFQQGGKVHRHGSPERTSDLQRTNDSLAE
jgi:hypothetical protein